MSEWLENKGRQRAPFKKGTLIEVVKLHEDSTLGLLVDKAPEVCECGGAVANDWTRDPDNPTPGDIVRYRLHEVD